MESNQTIELSYDIAVEKGLINLEIIDPRNGVLWEKEIAEPEIDVVEVMTSESGLYHGVIQGNEAQGRFEVE